MATTAANSDLGLLFFVVAVIYLLIFCLLVFRASVQLFSVKKFPNTRPMKVFRSFYGSLLIQAILNSSLYWVLFANQARDKGKI